MSEGESLQLSKKAVFTHNLALSSSLQFFSSMPIAVFATPILFNYSTWSLIVA